MILTQFLEGSPRVHTWFQSSRILIANVNPSKAGDQFLTPKSARLPVQRPYRLQTTSTLEQRSSTFAELKRNLDTKKEANETSDKQRTVTALSDRDSRVGFIRKVYATLGFQLFLTAAVAFSIGQSKQFLGVLFSKNGEWIVWLSLISSFLPLVILSLSTVARGSFPLSMLLLAWFTLGESVILGIITSFYQTRSVVMAMLQTSIATLGLTLYSFQPNPKYDLTGHGQAIFSALLVLLLCGILHLFFPSSSFDLFRTTLGAALFSVMLVYDTQLVVGGKHKKFEANSKDYILAAITLYLDIVNLFLYLLQLFGEKK